MTVKGEFALVTYLGHTIRIEESRLTIYTPEGEILASGRIQMSGARRLIRAQRRPAWMDDEDVARDNAELEREALSGEYESIDARRDA